MSLYCGSYGLVITAFKHYSTQRMSLESCITGSRPISVLS